jgi:hypothetical protein
MKNRSGNIFIALALLALLTLNLPLSSAHAQGTAFTYQGQLQNNGGLASGTYNLQFSLYDTNASGTPIAEPVTNNAVVVTNGLFTVTIDFGSTVWNGQTNWLQIGVRKQRYQQLHVSVAASAINARALCHLRRELQQFERHRVGL